MIKLTGSLLGVKKYPILIQYQNKINVSGYSQKINFMLEKLKQDYHYSKLDAMLVLKDILYHTWKTRKISAK